ncbi:MAG TPA: mechanosensitive ion channel family protein [Chitinophagales bacterium]|nr:mechanosensitive ion channel family protein [Chitinophagales bacterium]
MLLQVTENFEDKVSKVQSWTGGLINLLPNIAMALAFLIFIFALSRYVRRLTHKLMQKQSENPAISKIIAGAVATTFIIIGIFISLGILGLDKTVTSLLAGAGILGLAIGLALQDTLTSAISGIIMTTRKAYRIGDYVETNGYNGFIDEINLRNTTITQTNGIQAKIPNKMVLNNPLENYTLSGERRIELNVGVDYNSDLIQVEQVVRNAILNNVNFNHTKDLEFYWIDFADNTIRFIVRLWIPKFRQADYYQAQHEALVAIWAACKKNNILLPNPVRVLRFEDETKLTITKPTINDL